MQHNLPLSPLQRAEDAHRRLMMLEQRQAMLEAIDQVRRFGVRPFPANVVDLVAARQRKETS